MCWGYQCERAEQGVAVGAQDLQYGRCLAL